MPTFEITTPDGRTFDITGDTQEGALAALKKHLGSEETTTAEVDTSVGGAAKFGYDNAGKLIGQGIQGIGELTGSEGIENYGKEMAERNEQEIAEANYQRPEGADGIIKNLREGDLANAGKSLLYGSAEAAPQVLAGTAASIGAGLAVTSAPIVGTTVAIGGTVYGTLSALGETRDENEEKGIDTTATMQDLGAAVTSGLIELLPIKGGGYTVKILKEGIQEAGQEATIMGNTAIKGGEYVTDEVVNRMGDAGLIGSTLSGAANTAISTVTKTGEVVFKPRQELAPEVDQAAGDVSRMIKEISEDSGYNLKDIDPTSMKGANQTLTSVRKAIQTEVNASADQIRQQIVKDLDPETIDKFKRIVNTSNLKVGGNVTPADIQFVKDIAGSTEVGQKMVNGLYKSNVLTELYASGLKGGFSKFTDVFNPINNVGKGYNPARDVAGMLNFGAIAGTGGASLATQIPLVAGGRAIDAVTGRRSKVNRFVKKNIKKSGLNTPTGTSLPLNKAQQAQANKKAKDAINKAMKKAAKAKADAEKQALFVKMYEEGQHPNPESPRGIAHTGLREIGNLGDMTPAQIDAEILRVLNRRLAKESDASVRKALNAYKSHLKTGKMPDNDQTLSYTVGVIKGGFKFPKIDPAAPTSPVTPTPSAPLQNSPAVQQGIDDNRKFVQNLKNKLASDLTVSDGDRAVLNDSLDEYGLSLGSNPEQSSLEITFRARKALDNRQLVEKYLMPYHQRVLQQQAEIKVKGKKNAPTKTTAAPQETPQPSGQGTASGQTAVQGTGEAKPTQLASSGVLATTTQETPKVKKVTVKAVKDIIPDTEAIIQIGKKGTKYENGIQDVDTALEVANLLGITAQMMNSGTSLQDITNTDSGTAAVHSWNPKMKGFGSKVFAIKSGGSFEGKKVPPIESLMSLLHEMGHSLTQGNMDGKGEFGITLVKNPFSGKKDIVGGSSYNSSVMKPILEGKGKDHPAIKEIQAFQEAGIAFTQKDPNSKVEARDIRKMLLKLNLYKDPDLLKGIKKQLKGYRAYTNITAELSVDPMWLYLMNPKLAKELMPVNTKLIQKEFDKANNGKIKFYGHPLATVLAIVTAMVAMNSGEDEEPNEGILSPQDGILSA